MGITRQQIGKKGEDLALKFLQERGMKLVARNWRSGHKELDLIMDDGTFLRFVEVKTLCYPNSAAPVEMVDWHKQKMLVQAANRYIAQFKINKEVAFDVVSVLINGEIYKIDYIPTAFEPNW